VTDTFRPAVIRGVEFGPGRPKICVPLTGETVEALADGVAALDFDIVDLVELRIDYFEFVDDTDEVLGAIETVRDGLPDTTPLLFTFRSKPEGGQRDIDPHAYERLLLAAVRSGFVDALDVEMFTELGSLERLVNGAHERGVAVIMSSHDFEHTPPLEQIVARLTLQQDLGADIVKIAVMPEAPSDVLTLLQATEVFSERASRPAMTMSMGPLGVVSRLAGETFGSCATFGSVGEPSAPGQVDAAALRVTLDLLHDAQAP
jgi:3-dehydroquinate dehydratase-1